MGCGFHRLPYLYPQGPSMHGGRRRLCWLQPCSSQPTGGLAWRGLQPHASPHKLNSPRTGPCRQHADSTACCGRMTGGLAARAGVQGAHLQERRCLRLLWGDQGLGCGVWDLGCREQVLGLGLGQGGGWFGGQGAQFQDKRCLCLLSGVWRAGSGVVGAGLRSQPFKLYGWHSGFGAHISRRGAACACFWRSGGHPRRL